MLQDIAPYKFHCEYESREVNLKQDYLLAYKGDKVLLKDGHIPFVSELQEMLALEDLQFLFTVDEIAFYSPKEALIETNGLEYKSIQKFRTYLPRQLAFAGITGYHLATWYAGNKFCGACGSKIFIRKTRGLSLVLSAGELSIQTFPWLLSLQLLMERKFFLRSILAERPTRLSQALLRLVRPLRIPALEKSWKRLDLRLKIFASMGPSPGVSPSP